MLIQSIIYLPSIVGISGIATFVLARSRQLNFRLYGLFSLTLSVWLFFQYLTDAHVPNGTLWLRLASFCLSILAPTFIAFVYTYPSSPSLPRGWMTLISLPMLLLAVLSFTPLLVDKVSYSGNGSTNFIAGSLFNIQSYTLIAYLLGGIILLALNLKKANARQKTQVYFLALAFSFPLLGNILAGYVFPDSTYWQAARPTSILLMVIIITYAMVYHRLFDIRSFVIRSVAYLWVLTITSLIYVVPTTLITTYLLHLKLKPLTLIILSLITLVVAIIYQPMRTRFNRITNKFFFRDYYDPQEVLDKISSFLVGTVDTKLIENQSSLILLDSIKPSSIDYLLLAEEGGKNSQLLKQLLKQRRDIVVVDELNQHSQSALHTAMSEANVAVATRLKTAHQDLGFIVLGFKQSGGVYSDADKKLLGIMADEIAIGLQNALRFEEIQQFNITLQQKVEDATKQLRLANTRLKELDATKDEFISMASHQLRTPLTSIKGYLSMILEGDAGKVTMKEKDMIQTAFDSAERMVFLIADLLNVSRLQSGKFVIENKPTDLAKMVTGTVNQLQETAKNHHLTLTYNPPAKFPIVNVDETKIQQVVMNFMDNAIYYTPSGGSIDVKLEETDNEIRYTVTDTGLGVPAGEQRHLFSKFYRAGNARKMRPDGTGLGLFMAKKVIVAQGGAIIFKSTEGKGSTFGFSFPRSKVELKGEVAEKPARPAEAKA